MNTPRTYAKSPELEAAVIADPENDLPRLVYADWLDEHDDPHRAAFIRAQCALWDKNPADDDYPDWVESLRESGQALLFTHPTIDPKLPDGVDFPGNPAKCDGVYSDPSDGFHRGFPSFVGIPNASDVTSEGAIRFAAALPEVFRTTTCRGIQIEYDYSHHTDVILNTSVEANISALEIRQMYEAPDEASLAIQAVTRSSAAPNLRWLKLDAPNSDFDAVALSKGAFQRLQRLGLASAKHISANGAGALFTSPWLESVSRWDGAIYGRHVCRIALGRLSKLPRLHTIVTYGHDELFTTLSRGGEFTELGRLQFIGWVDKARRWNSLAKAQFPKLACFAPGHGMTDEHVLAVLQADWFGQLHTLKLSGKFGNEAVLALAKHPVAKTVRHLSLAESAMRVKGVQALARDFPSLTSLEFGYIKGKLDESVVVEFLTDFSASNLRHLSLSSLPLGDEAIAALASNPRFARLKKLSLSWCLLSKKGIHTLLHSPHLQGLVCLDLKMNFTPKSKQTHDARDNEEVVKILKDPGVMPHLVGWR